MKYPKPRGNRHAQRLTGSDIEASEKLRVRAVASGIDRHLLAFAADCSIGHLRHWLGMRYHLQPDTVARLSAWLDQQQKPKP
jgi:hypothetical protein